MSCLLSPPSTLNTDTLNTHCSMEDADDTFYSIKDIKQINDEEFEAVFEFDSNGSIHYLDKQRRHLEAESAIE